MSTDTWQTVVNRLAYGIQFEAPSQERAAHDAKRLLDNPQGSLTQQRQYELIHQASQVSSAQLSPLVPEERTEAELRGYLTAILQAMDAARPWPTIPFRPLAVYEMSAEEWQRFAQAPVVAALSASVPELQASLKTAFDPAPEDGRDVVVLELESGLQLALVERYWPESRDIGLLSPAAAGDSANSAEAIRAEFQAATGISQERIAPVNS